MVEELEEQIRHYVRRNYGNLIYYNLLDRHDDIVASLNYSAPLILKERLIFFKLTGIGEIKATENGLEGTPREEINKLIAKAEKQIGNGIFREE